MNKKHSVKVPRSRGLKQEEIFRPFVLETPAQTPVTVADLIIHAAICRIAYDNNHNEEFLTKFDKYTNTIDIDISEEFLEYLEKINIGPKLERYFSWLTNSFANLRRDVIQFTIGATAITAGLQGIGAQLGYNAVIERVDVVSNANGNMVLDIWKVNPLEWPGSVANSIAGTQPITLSNNNKHINIPITTWDTTLSYGDILVYNIDSISGLSLITVTLYVLRDH